MWPTSHLFTFNIPNKLESKKVVLLKGMLVVEIYSSEKKNVVWHCLLIGGFLLMKLQFFSNKVKCRTNSYDKDISSDQMKYEMNSVSTNSVFLPNIHMKDKWLNQR